MASIRLEELSKVYPKGRVGVRDLDLGVEDGELVVLVGPSGCGKSTTLRLVAGLESPTRGRIYIGETDVTDLPSRERDIAMVFQSYALYPHKTVRENLEFGLRVRGTSRELIDQRVETAARALEIEPLLEDKPRKLSGGQRQRVALGRAIVREPRAFLLDEPLSNLDAKLRVQTRAELARLHRRLGATMLYVTHDQEEAMTLGDRVAVMRDGTIEQVAAPMEVYERPASVFVGEFIGSPAMNVVPCRARAETDALWLDSRFFAIDLRDEARPELTGRDISLGIRPQDIRIRPSADGADATARVDVVETLGPQILAHLEVEQRGATLGLRLVAPAARAPREGDTVPIQFLRDRVHLFDPGTGRRLTSETLS